MGRGKRTLGHGLGEVQVEGALIQAQRLEAQAHAHRSFQRFQSCTRSQSETVWVPLWGYSLMGSLIAGSKISAMGTSCSPAKVQLIFFKMHPSASQPLRHVTEPCGNPWASPAFWGKEITPFFSKSCNSHTWLLFSGERPFVCLICLSAFTTKANCERHLKVHTDTLNGKLDSGLEVGSRANPSQRPISCGPMTLPASLTLVPRPKESSIAGGGSFQSASVLLPRVPR